MHANFAEQLEKLNTSYSKSLVELGDEYYRGIVKPLCEKYGLGFLSGNGTYFFHRPDEDAFTPLALYIRSFQEILDLPSLEKLQSYEDSELSPLESLIVNNPHLVTEIEPIFKVLDTPTCEGPFGYYV
jgi:hypothetical protein